MLEKTVLLMSLRAGAAEIFVFADAGVGGVRVLRFVEQHDVYNGAAPSSASLIDSNVH